MSKSNFQVDLQPTGRRIEVPAATSVLEAARQAGVELVSICGGEGICGTCRVRLVSGQLSAPSGNEEAVLSAKDLAEGYRLACEAKVLSDVLVDIPPETFTTPQRLQLECQDIPTELDPPLVPLDIKIPPPSLSDLRADHTRLRQALPHSLRINLHLLSDLSDRLRSMNWQARLVQRADEVVAILPSGAMLYGLAVDIGTTKLAAYLVEMESGETVAKHGAMNPQIAYGEDVISRIRFSNENADGAKQLQEKLIEALNRLIKDLCSEVNASTDQVVEAVVVGNTAMHHLFAGLPVRQLGESPYVAAVSEALEIQAAELGLSLSPGARVYLPPNIAGYVGADHVAMLIGSDLQNVRHTTLALDIGTNTEVSLFHKGNHWTCSCASGPAFEGAHIRDGMRAAPGAIERVQIQGERVRVHTIGNQAPTGICGSGILDSVAELLKSGLLDKRGSFKGKNKRLHTAGSETTFALVHAGESGSGREIAISRKDINELQLAKAAIRSGIDLLLMEAGIQAKAVEQFLVAGAFGTYLNLESAVQIGMFLDLPRSRFQQIGNAAGSGARQLLVSRRLRVTADALAQYSTYIELAKHPEFMKVYMKALRLEKG